MVRAAVAGAWAGLQSEHVEFRRHLVRLRQAHCVVEALRALEEMDRFLDAPAGLVLSRKVVRGCKVTRLVDDIRRLVELLPETQHADDRQPVLGLLIILQCVVEVAVRLEVLCPPLKLRG